MDKLWISSMVCSHPDAGLFSVAATGAAKRRRTVSNNSKKKPPPKLDLLIARLQRPDGATIDELMKATAWQAHSVRGAMAGTLKKKGYSVTSAKTDGVRRYKLAEATDA